jgi:copper chaperone CopZ
VCAHAVRVTIEKLPGVESADVSLNEGRVQVQLKAGNAVTLAQLRQSVERNGFTPQQAIVRAQADVAPKGETVQLTISGTEEVYTLADTAHADDVLQQLRKSAGQRVLIEGIVPPRRDQRTPAVIQVNGVKPVKRR